MAVTRRSKTYEELKEQMQEVIDNVAEQLRRDAVKTLVVEGERVNHISIEIEIGYDLVPNITYNKIVYVTPIVAVTDDVVERK